MVAPRPPKPSFKTTLRTQLETAPIVAGVNALGLSRGQRDAELAIRLEQQKRQQLQPEAARQVQCDIGDFVALMKQHCITPDTELHAGSGMVVTRTKGRGPLKRKQYEERPIAAKAWVLHVVASDETLPPQRNATGGYDVTTVTHRQGAALEAAGRLWSFEDEPTVQTHHDVDPATVAVGCSPWVEVPETELAGSLSIGGPIGVDQLVPVDCIDPAVKDPADQPRVEFYRNRLLDIATDAIT